MAASFSVGGSSVTDLPSWPCLCLDALPPCNLSSGDLIMNRNLISRKHMPRPAGSLQLSSSFLDSVKALSGSTSLRGQRKNRNFKIVSEVAGQYEDSFADVKAVRTFTVYPTCL